jgi:hypothetical protein
MAVRARLEMAEKRFDATLAAVRRVRPVTKVFHETLSDERKTRFTRNRSPRGNGLAERASGQRE